MAAGVPSGHPLVGVFCSLTEPIVVVVVGGTVLVVVGGGLLALTEWPPDMHADFRGERESSTAQGLLAKAM
jgi:hypothetical protein